MLYFSSSEKYYYSLPKGHRFPIEKYGLVQEKLLREGVIQPEQIFHPERASRQQIALAHCQGYVRAAWNLALSESQQRALGLPLTATSLNRARCSVAGTICSVDNALKNKAAANFGGGTHHAFSDRPEGFCLFNDLAVAASYALKVQHLHKILIVDLDVHQGNGTAAIFRNNKQVFTFSMHCAQNYPLHKETSDLDCALPQATDDDTYLQELAILLPTVIHQWRPQLIIYQAGVDVLAGDKLGKFQLSLQACASRDRLVMELCQRENIPLVVTMGGGYHASLATLVNAHANTFQLLVKIFS